MTSRISVQRRRNVRGVRLLERRDNSRQESFTAFLIRLPLLVERFTCETFGGPLSISLVRFGFAHYS